MDNYTCVVRRTYDQNQRHIFVYQNDFEVAMFLVNFLEDEFTRQNVLRFISKITTPVTTGNDGPITIKTLSGNSVRTLSVDYDVMTLTVTGVDLFFHIALKNNKSLLKLMNDILDEHDREIQRLIDRDDVL